MYLYRRRVAAGTPVADMEKYPDDFIEYLFPASTNDSLLFFSESGQAFAVPVSEIPEGDRGSRGRPLQQLLGLEKGDRMCSLLMLSRQLAGSHLVFVTASGTIKRTPADQFGTQRSGGVNAINLRPGDRLIDAHVLEGNPDIVLMSAAGRAIRFETSEIPEMGRTAQGVRAMKLADADHLIGSVVVRRDTNICVISRSRRGRRMPLADFRVQKRDGRGVTGVRIDERSGPLIGAMEVLSGDNLMLLAVASGETLRISADDVPAGVVGDALVPIAAAGSGSPIERLGRAADRAPITPEDDSVGLDNQDTGGEGLPPGAEGASAVVQDGDTVVEQFDLLQGG
jgi:DNA gyrase subunit A